VVLLDPSTLPDRGGRPLPTKALVEEAKFGTAARLAGDGVDFLFLEMDVFLIRNPRALWDARGDADVVISVHQENFNSINAGFYMVRAGEKTRRLFRSALDFLVKYPSSWDQTLLECLMISQDPRASRGKCTDLPGNLSDPVVLPIHGESGAGGFQVALIDPDVVVSAPRPFFFRDSVAVHVLTDAPLTSSHGKKVVAKEMMLWEGASCYYCVGAAAEEGTNGGLPPGPGRYLAYDDVISTNLAYNFHEQRAADAILLHLAAAALATNRTLILPMVFDSQRYIYGWQMLDTESLVRLGVDWREASFLRNPRLELPAALSVGHATIAEDSLTVQRVTSTLRRGRFGPGAGGHESHRAVYTLPATDLPSKWEQVWSVLAHDTSRGDGVGIADSDVLFLHFDQTTAKGGGLADPHPRERFCFRLPSTASAIFSSPKHTLSQKAAALSEALSAPSPTTPTGLWEPPGCRSQGSPKDVTHPLLIRVRSQLRWCMAQGPALGRDERSRIFGRDPTSDCYTLLDKERRLRERRGRQKVKVSQEVQKARNKEEEERASQDSGGGEGKVGA